MPVLSVFYGLIVYMFNKEGGQHNLPHIHVEYSGTTSVFDLKGNLLQGELPSNKTQILKTWMLLHEEELGVCWALISKGLPIKKIKPLK